jgi:hypothetical protein
MGRNLRVTWTIETGEEFLEAMRWPEDAPVPGWLREDFLWLLLFALEHTVRVELKRRPKE